jgi:hypothetical protein
MDQATIKKILRDVANGGKTADEAYQALSAIPFADIGIAKHDGHRVLRNGFTEVILCEGKRPEHVVSIVREAARQHINLLGTRANPELLTTLKTEFPGLGTCELSRTFHLLNRSPERLEGSVAVLAAGTADMAVAEEAVRTVQFFGVEPARHYDIGVAGIHRLFSCLDDLRSVDVLIVVAGMEGALPSVVGGLLPAPIIAVPTSVGYGAHFKGVAALLGMLNSCSEGISVVNIDNGFGAACAALRILRCRKQPD